MTIDGMNHIPENSSNYGPPNGYIPSNFMNGSWRDPSHLINNAWTQAQPLANSWKPSDALPSMPPPVAECVILDQDPHRMGMELPPPPPPPFIFPSPFNAATAPLPQFNSVQDFYFFNPPNQSIHQPPQSVSESSHTTSSPPINPNEEVDMSISSGTGRSSPENLNSVLPFESQPTEYIAESEEQESYRVYEGESVAAQIINCPEPYIPAEMPSAKRQTERRERHRSRSRSPRRRDPPVSPTRHKSRSDKRRESSSRKDTDRGVEKLRKDSDRTAEKSKERSSSARRRRSPSISRSRRHDDRDYDRHHISSKSTSDRRKEKSPSSRRSHHHSRRSVSPKKSYDHRTSSSRRRSESINREKDKQESSEARAKETPNVVDQQLQEFAQQIGDPDAMLKKLKQKMMEKLKKTVMDAPPSEETVSESDSADNNKSIRLYYDTQSTGENVVSQNGEGNEYVITNNAREDEGGESSDEDGEIYPWYRNAPIQHHIGENFQILKGTEFSSRPQNDKDENGIIRTFPKRTKVYIPSKILSPRNDVQPPLNKNANIVKDAGSGFIVRRNGAMSWVSKALMSNADAANMNANAAAQHSPNSHFTNKSIHMVNGQRITSDANECFEYIKTKICQAGALCKYTHNGHNEHQKIKFCQKYLNGLCRDGDRCRYGSHNLLPHQIPVCGYYLRASCPYLKGCQFLHVKHSAKTPLCIHFNKGKCLAEFPCVFTHRYCPTLINARSYNGKSMTEEESRKLNFDDIPRLQWFED